MVHLFVPLISNYGKCGDVRIHFTRFENFRAKQSLIAQNAFMHSRTSNRDL